MTTPDTAQSVAVYLEPHLAALQTEITAAREVIADNIRRGIRAKDMHTALLTLVSTEVRCDLAELAVNTNSWQSALNRALQLMSAPTGMDGPVIAEAGRRGARDWLRQHRGEITRDLTGWPVQQHPLAVVLWEI